MNHVLLLDISGVKFPYFIGVSFGSSSSSSSVGGTGGNPAYRTSAFEAVCTFNPVLVSSFTSRGAPRQTA
jgi:hypothetical protein